MLIASSWRGSCKSSANVRTLKECSDRSLGNEQVGVCSHRLREVTAGEDDNICSSQILPFVMRTADDLGLIHAGTRGNLSPSSSLLSSSSSL